MNWRKWRLSRWLRERIRKASSWYKYSDWSPRTVKYNFKNRFINKRNKIHLKRYSDWQWVDFSDSLRHLPFVVLTRFIEEELPFDHIVTDEPPQDKDWAELKDHYEWYKNFREFDTFEYMEEKLGYQPNFGWENEPLEESGTDEWGEPKLFRMNFRRKPLQEDVLFRMSYDAEERWNQEFTRRACRIIELYGYLWT